MPTPTPPPRSRTSPRAQTYAILAALAVALYASWLVILPFLGVIAWAVVMTVLFYPVHWRIEERLGRRGLAALCSTLLVIFTLLLPTAAVLTATVAELREMSTGMPATVSEWLDPNNPTTGSAVRAVERFVTLDRLRDPKFVEQSISNWGMGVASGSLRIVGGAASLLVEFALIVFTMFFLFKDARLIRASIYEKVPIENKRLWALFVRTRDVINASVYGTLLLSVIQGGLGGAAFWVLGLPSPFLWGVVMTLAAIIPMLGAFVVWVPAAIYLVSMGEVGKAIALAAWGTVVIGMADNVLRPILVGNKTQMHELLVFFGVLGGIAVFGVLGLVMGPVIFAVTLALIEALRQVGIAGGRDTVPPASNTEKR